MCFISLYFDEQLFPDCSTFNSRRSDFRQYHLYTRASRGGSGRIRAPFRFVFGKISFGTEDARPDLGFDFIDWGNFQVLLLTI